jgi:hypothetical protein
MRRAPFILLVMAWLVAGGDPPRAAQPFPPPEIVVSGRAEGKVAADRATIHMAVTTRADTAAAAGAENARVQQRVIEALQRLGMDRSASRPPDTTSPRTGDMSVASNPSPRAMLRATPFGSGRPPRADWRPG